MKSRLFSFKPMLGIDIQSHAIHIIQLGKSKLGWKIEQAAMRSLAEGLMVGGKIKDWDTVSAVLEELVHTLGLENKAVAVSLPANLTQMQHIQVPSGMSDVEIEMEIRSQVERDFPGMDAALCLDFTVHKPKSGCDWDVFFVVAREDEISPYVQCIRSAGLKVSIVDIDLFALKRVSDLSISVSPKPNIVNAVIFSAHERFIFLLVDAHKILHHEQWDKNLTTDLESQLNHRIDMILAAMANKEIQHVVIYIDKKYHHRLHSENHTYISAIHDFDPWNKLLVESHLHTPLDFANRSDFLIACGLAMREVPKWS